MEFATTMPPPDVAPVTTIDERSRPSEHDGAMMPAESHGV